MKVTTYYVKLKETFPNFPTRGDMTQCLQAIDSDDLTRSYFAKYYNKSSPSTEATAASTTITRCRLFIFLSRLALAENKLHKISAVYPLN